MRPIRPAAVPTVQGRTAPLDSDGAQEPRFPVRERDRRRSRVAAAVGHALAFGTSRSLVREQQLDDHDAVDLMCGLVASAAVVCER